jgi:hypothetical protein
MRIGKLAYPLLAVLLIGVPAVAAQSLGQVAQQARQQRAKTTTKPVKVYTNDNLPPPAPWEEPSPSTPAAKSTTKPEAESSPKETPSAAKTTAGEGSEPAQKTKEYWQEKFTAARSELAEAQSAQRLAQDELSLLQIQQARELDPDIQSEVKAKIEAKQTELAGLQTRIDKAQKSLDDLQKEFEASGAPAEWSQPAVPSPEEQTPIS